MVLVFSANLISIPYAVLGNINIPDAYVLPNKMMEFSFTNYFVLAGTSYAEMAQDGADAIGGADGYNLSFSASVGLFDRFELGFVATNYDLYFGNAKLKIVY